MSKAKITDLPKLLLEYESGLSTVQLAKQYDTSATVINGWLKKGGAKMRSLVEAHADFSGENNPNFKGRGTYVKDGTYLCPDANGYLRRIAKGHPLADEHGLIGEHVYQACLKYGIDEIRGKDVHHENGNKADNDWKNLEVKSYSEHRTLENHRMWATRKR